MNIRSDHTRTDVGPSFTSPSSASPLPSLPTSPSRQSPNTPLHSQPSVGLLTPSSSWASLSCYKGLYQPALSTDLQPEPNHTPPNRRLFFPVRASLNLKQPARSTTTITYMPEVAVSRPTSPVRRSRAMSPKRPEHRTQPQSRCESLLRDTLRRADEQERSLARRTMSRSPPRWTRGRSRLRDNSFLEALRRDDSPDSDCDVDNLVRRINGGNSFGNRDRAQAMTIHGRGTMSTSSTDRGSAAYGSPSSPSPMPPIMTRTRTAPTVPRIKGGSYDDEQRGGPSRSPASPPIGRRSLPNTVSHSHTSMGPSNEASPKQRMSTLSPHESVLRAKLEYVLQKAGSPPADEATLPSQIAGRERRKHQRAFSHGVTVVISPKHRDNASPDSSSPQSLTPSSSNSATDLARANLTSSHRRDSLAYRTSSSSPAEPLTPPPTPPFNARTASEVCRRIDGYVSFASVEGLGEPPGLDMDSDDNEEGLRKLGRWLRMLPVPFRNGGQGASEHERDQVIVNRHRSGSTSGSR